MTLPIYYLGLDLGQASDYSALALLERQVDTSPAAEAARRAPQRVGPHEPEQKDERDDEYQCRYLHRWPLRTSYPAIVADVVARLRSEPLCLSRPQPWLAVDATGCGAPVIDLLRAEVEAKTLRAQLEPVLITGGSTVTHERDVTHCPKRDLVSVVQVALQNERLKIASALPLADTLTKELQNFKVKISLESGHDSYGEWREGQHDDLVLSLALALWIARFGVDRSPEPSRSYSGVGQYHVGSRR
jgi:hypothetical protein